MRKLNTAADGGMPFELDDLENMLNGLYEAYAGLASFMGDNVILSGVVMDRTNPAAATYSAGYVVLNGEICKVDAGGPFNLGFNPFVYIELDITYDAAGTETFFDLSTHDTYEIRKAKLISYPEAQAGKQDYALTETAPRIIDRFILPYTHNFTKRQSWAYGGSSTLVANQIGFGCLVANGNFFDVNIDAANVPVTAFSFDFPNGTWLAVRFTGSAGKTVAIENGVAAQPILAQGKSYLFETGEVAMFIIDDDGKAILINGTRLNEKWHVPGASGEPAFTFFWTHGLNNLRFRKDAQGNVHFEGSGDNINYTTGVTDKVCTLPAGYRPSQNVSVSAWDVNAGQMGLFTIKTNGDVTFISQGRVSTHAGFNMNLHYSTL